MDDKTWERYGALGAVWFVVLGVIGSMIAGTPPGRGDSAAEITEWYVDNDSAIQIGAFLAAVGVIGLVWWFGTLYRAMASAEDGTPRVAIIALVGFVISGFGAMSGFAVNAATAAGIDEIGEGSVFFFGLASVFFGFSPIGDVIMALAIAGLTLRTGFLPKWLAQFSYLVAATSLAAALGIASDADFYGFFGFIGFLIWALWVLVIGVVLYQKSSAAA